jgi:Zn-dependent peptidase ImmA (M78 family)
MKVPWLPKKTIQRLATHVIDAYEKKIACIGKPPIPVEDIIERGLNLKLAFIDFQKELGISGVLGATYIDQRLICANQNLLKSGTEGRLNFTFAHEIAHWVLHRQLVVSTYGARCYRSRILCRTSDRKKPIEWQADYFASCLLMPEDWINRGFQKVYGSKPLKICNIESTFNGPIYYEPCVNNWCLIADAVRKAGGFSNVSKEAMMIRLQDLGLVINETATPMGWRRAEASSATF